MSGGFQNGRWMVIAKTLENYARAKKNVLCTSVLRLMAIRSPCGIICFVIILRLTPTIDDWFERVLEARRAPAALFVLRGFVTIIEQFQPFLALANGLVLRHRRSRSRSALLARGRLEARRAGAEAAVVPSVAEDGLRPEAVLAEVDHGLVGAHLRLGTQARRAGLDHDVRGQRGPEVDLGVGRGRGGGLRGRGGRGGGRPGHLLDVLEAAMAAGKDLVVVLDAPAHVWREELT